VDEFDSVLSLHTSDLVYCLNTMYGHGIDYEVEVKERCNFNDSHQNINE
jgi:hypothetical protein